ncbi:MAG: SpoIIE family protein phosphatase [Thermoguttaceae bacterium]|jgi:serine phosphatase RsbU (regulator of sigma subunit)|nr:SpoIIE family protein phosphatase [Thermoguttaceae bacterium]
MESTGVRILLVEDDPDDVWVMRNLLSDRWDGPYELVHVELLSTAIELCAKRRFDVVLLDLALPDSQGLETFFAINAQVDDVPIVVLSGYSDESAAMKAVQAGAQDYLVKGQVDDHLLVRSIRYAIERSRRHQAERAMLDASEEFRAAGEIQQRLYPVAPPRIPGFDIAGALFPAKATAGDYFDYIPMVDGSWAIVVGDVSSHGMGPALLMSETRACLRTLAQSCSDMGEILTRTNRVLAADTGDFHFVTLAMVRIDPGDRSMVYASAGQRGYLFHNDQQVSILESTALPLGVRADTTVPCGPERILEPGELLTFFTDGVVEAESPGRVRFGYPRALELIRSEREKPAADIVGALHHELRDFSHGMPQRDDITVVVLKVLQP